MSLGALHIPFPTIHLPRRFWVQHNQQVTVPVAASTVTTAQASALQAVASPAAAYIAQPVSGALVPQAAIANLAPAATAALVGPANVPAASAAAANASTPSIDQLLCELRIAKLRNEQQQQASTAAGEYEQKVKRLEEQVDQLLQQLDQRQVIPPGRSNSLPAPAVPKARTNGNAPTTQTPAQNSESSVRFQSAATPTTVLGVSQQSISDERAYELEARLERMERMIAVLCAHECAANRAVRSERPNVVRTRWHDPAQSANSHGSSVEYNEPVELQRLPPTAP